MAVPDLLRALLEAPGPPGSESEATAVWRRAAEPFAEVRARWMESAGARRAADRDPDPEWARARRGGGAARPAEGGGETPLGAEGAPHRRRGARPRRGALARHAGRSRRPRRAAARAPERPPRERRARGEPEETGEQRLGGGAAILRGPGISPRLFELLRETAERDGIPHSVEVSTGRSHTDADAVYTSRAGIPTGVVSIPTRYLHTPVETCDLDDVEACVRLLVAFARRLRPGVSFGR